LFIVSRRLEFSSRETTCTRGRFVTVWQGVGSCRLQCFTGTASGCPSRCRLALASSSPARSDPCHFPVLHWRYLRVMTIFSTTRLPRTPLYGVELQPHAKVSSPDNHTAKSYGHLTGDSSMPLPPSTTRECESASAAQAWPNPSLRTQADIYLDTSSHPCPHVMHWAELGLSTHSEVHRFVAKRVVALEFTVP
jgi:hypothetical protein